MEVRVGEELGREDKLVSKTKGLYKQLMLRKIL